MCECCNGGKSLLKHPKSNFDSSEAVITKDRINRSVLALAIDTGQKIRDNPLRHCYDIPISYCPKCGTKL